LVAWPERRDGQEAVVQIDRRVLIPLVGSVLLMAGMVSVPAGKRALAGEGFWKEPLAHAEIQAALTGLQGVAAPEALEQYGQRLDALRSRGISEQYGHAGLEAADHLLGRIRAEASEQADRLESLAGLLRLPAAEGAGAGAVGEAMKPRASGAALRELQAGPLGLGPELGRSLGGMDGDAVGDLGREEAEELAGQLERAAGVCRECAGGGYGGGSGEPRLAADGESRADSGGEPEEAGGSGSGKGSGTGEAPQREAEPKVVPRGPLEVVGGGKADGLPGTEVLGERVRDAALRRTDSGLRPGGGAAAGGGGEALRGEVLMPGEKAVLRRYFR
jgi:hypothetical protein